MFITFEGIEGSGKTTQIKLFADFLKEKNFNCLITKEPGGTELGLKIREILLNSKSEICSESELFLFIADRIQHLKALIIPALQQNKIVLCDRYFDSTIAYQKYARGLDLSILNYLDFLKPDITFLLDLPVEHGLLRVSKRKDIKTRFEQESIDFHNKVRLGYLEIAKINHERFRIINALLKEEEVQGLIKKMFFEFLENKKMPRTRLELVQGYAPRDFKSLASTSSATQAFKIK